MTDTARDRAWDETLDDVLVMIRCSGRRLLAVIDRDGRRLLVRLAVGARQAWVVGDVDVIESWPHQGRLRVRCPRHTADHLINQARLADVIEGRNGRIVSIDVRRVELAIDM